RYNDVLGGVLLCYDTLRAQQTSARTISDSPFGHFDVDASLLLFAPIIGSEMVGIVHKVSEDHVGILVFGSFNVSIPKNFIHSDLMYDKDEFKWYDPADDSGARFEEGSTVRFEIQSWETKNDVFYIIGALPSDKKRIVIANAEAAEEEESEAEDLELDNKTIEDLEATGVVSSAESDEETRNAIVPVKQEQFDASITNANADAGTGTVEKVRKVKKEKKDKKDKKSRKRKVSEAEPVGEAETAEVIQEAPQEQKKVKKEKKIKEEKKDKKSKKTKKSKK
ncbi:hypothetical protein SARC_11976, partial [Sphaeroforma arctica JP610]